MTNLEASGWAADTATALTRTLTHIVTATLVTAAGEEFTLDLVDGRVTFDETTAPRTQAQLSARVPTDVALLGRLDPRTGCRVRIEAGYLRAGGILDVHQLANLGLRSRSVARPDDRLALSAASDEALIIDNSPVVGAAFNAPDTLTAIMTVVDAATGGSAYSTNVAAGPAVVQGPYSDRWGLAADLANELGATLYVDDAGLVHIDAQPTLGTTPALTVAPGTGGTLVESDATLDRDGWANQVTVRYTWRDTSDVDHTITATRRVTTGPYAATATNTCTLLFEYDHATTQTRANAAAAAMVARTVTRGRAVRITTPSAYWVRPGDTIALQLPTGDPEHHLMSAVTFDLRTGLMDVTTRLPDNTGTIGA